METAETFILLPSVISGGGSCSRYCGTELNYSTLTLQVQFHLVAEKWLLLRPLLFLEQAEYVTHHSRSCPGYQSSGSSVFNVCDPWMVRVPWHSPYLRWMLRRVLQLF